MIHNYPFTLDDINSSNKIFGPNVPSLKREMVMWQPKPVVSNFYNIPKEILQVHKTVASEADIIFDNGMTLIVSISRHVKITTV